MSPVPMSQGEFLLYQTEDAQTRVQIRLTDGTLWLTQKQLAELYQVAVSTINGHLRTLYGDGELVAERTIRKFRIVAPEGARTVERLTDHYSLEAVLQVGYRVRSHRGTQFRRWATDLLKSYLVEGVALDDARFKTGEDSAYFERLLERIRDIRSSEKEFWRKVLDIFSTSIDYTANTETARAFFATVQNKMHWAAHGHTASELVSLRVDAALPNVGATNWPGQAKGLPIHKADVSVAKNFLTSDELDALNRMVMAYIEVAEIQAKARKPMTMRDWVSRLDGFLQMTEQEVLTHAGKVSAELAKAKAEAEFVRYQQGLAHLPSAAERDFEQLIVQPIQKISGRKPPSRTMPKMEDK
ncbi:MAG: hypothetical protein RIR18_35 [Pseudomonadota bacterium]|jgi:hypothetical protein